MEAIREQIKSINDDILKININVSAVDKELFYNTLTVSKAITSKINDCCSKFEIFKDQLDFLKEAIIEINLQTKSITNGGLTAALQSVLPTIITATSNKDIEYSKTKATIIIAVVGAAGTLLGLLLPYVFQFLSH